MAKPARGEVWLADLGLAAKVRPVLVLSVEPSDVDYALVAVVPHTTFPRGAAFEVDVPVPGLRTGVFNVQGLSAGPAAKLFRRIATLTAADVHDVETVVKSWLGMGR